MIFHEIDMVGKIWVEEVDALPTWTTADERRILYLNTTGVYYVGGSADWEAMTTGGNGAYISAVTADSHAGNITPNADNTLDLGSGAARYANIYGVNFVGTTTTATYADLAEIYKTDEKYPVGTIMRVSEAFDCDMTIADNFWDYPVGVISDKPGVILNAGEDGQPIALVGKTPIRVIGPAYKSGFLKLNGNGTAVATSGTDDMMAIALEDNPEEEEKLVMCLLKL